MKLITKDTDYAIRALGCMAQSREQLVTVVALSESLDMPRCFLRKILQRLTKKNILRSYKGKGGGFKLKKSAGDISVFEVMEVFQGDFSLNDHIFKGKICPVLKTCYLKQRFDRIEKSVKKQLESITIRQITKGNGLTEK